MSIITPHYLIFILPFIFFQLMAQSSYEACQPVRLLEIIYEMYRDTSIPQHLLNRSNGGDAKFLKSNSLPPMPAMVRCVCFEITLY